jgi:hypothetical protein
MTDKAKFEEWAVVELFGHQRIAGKVSEATIGGCAFVRVDVPDVPGDDVDAPLRSRGYTKYFGNGAIYAMTPCDEDVARLAVAEIERYNVPVRVQMPVQRQLAGASARNESDEDDDLPY